MPNISTYTHESAPQMTAQMAMTMRNLADQARTSGQSIHEIEQALGAEIPIGRFNDPEDIAAMALFLAGLGARNITGQAFNVDGGLVMH